MKSAIFNIFIAVGLWALLPLQAQATPVAVGSKAPDFSLETLDGQTVQLSSLTDKSDVVLVVLRGWPGYQCPYCTAQVSDFIASAAHFTEAGAHVVMVYPGPADDLKAHANQFLGNKSWPKDFTFVMDPDYKMVNAYGLRWDAPKETAYPSTFIIGRDGNIRFAKVAHGHGDRTHASDIVQQLSPSKDQPK